MTLIEAVMVICILAVVAGVAIPRVANSLAGQRVDAAARRIAGDLNLAQERARQASATQTVSFDLTGSTYQLVGMTDLDHPAAAFTVSLGSAPYEAQLASVAFGSHSTLHFDGFGIPDAGGTIVIHCGNQWRAVTVAAESGAVTIATVPALLQEVVDAPAAH
jgi:type II secretory pathway pseudopilin PulG